MLNPKLQTLNRALESVDPSHQIVLLARASRVQRLHRGQNARPRLALLIGLMFIQGERFRVYGLGIRL